MLKFRLLKYLRIVVSLFVLAGFLAGFSSLAVWCGEAAKGEFLPSFLRALTRFSIVSLVLFAVVAASALLAGRFYCSFCCPLGVMQDIFARLGRLVSFNRFRYKLQPNLKRTRCLVLLIAVLLALGGWIVPLGLLDPY